MATLIFDFGSNEGQNLHYYLEKADVVVAVEANPELINKIKGTFAKEILEGRLRVEQCLVSTKKLIKSHGRYQMFYLNNDNLLSTIVKPNHFDLSKWQETKMKCMSVGEIINLHMNVNDRLLFCKFDLEGFDKSVVGDMFNERIYPEYLSLEMNDPAGFDLLINSGRYKEFKLSKGYQIGRRLRNVEVLTRDFEVLPF
jgi:FkbM family methyltransferase